MKVELNEFNNDISALVPLTDFNYENIFKVYQDNGFYSYNILKKVTIPDDIATDYFDYVEISSKIPWTIISYKEYGTILLWWLICCTNKIYNPITLAEPGTIIKVIKAQYVRLIIDQIKAQLNI